MKWKYSHVDHVVRQLMGITAVEFIIFDVFFKTQTHPSYTLDGWTNLSYGDISDGIGISKGTVFSIVERGVRWGVMEVDAGNPKLKRTTSDWYDFAYLKEDQTDGIVFKNYRTSRSENERSFSERPVVQKMNENVQKMNGKEQKTKEFNLNDKKGDLKNLDSFQVTMLFAANQIANSDLLATLPPEEARIRKTIEKAYLYFVEWSAMKATICDPAKQKLTDLEFAEEIFQWVRRNSNDQNFVNNITKRITTGPSNLFGWIRNRKFLKVRNYESGINKKDQQIFTVDKAMEVYADIHSNGFR